MASTLAKLCVVSEKICDALSPISGCCHSSVHVLTVRPFYLLHQDLQDIEEILHSVVQIVILRKLLLRKGEEEFEHYLNIP